MKLLEEESGGKLSGGWKGFQMVGHKQATQGRWRGKFKKEVLNFG